MPVKSSYYFVFIHAGTSKLKIFLDSLLQLTADSLTRNCPERILPLIYVAAERTLTYSKHISRDRYRTSLLARLSDL
jgi:hypothetical protein